MKATGLAAATTCLLMLIGCSGIEVATDYNREWDFAPYRTYDWAAQKVPELRDPLIDTSLLENRVKRAVEREMSTKGYSQSVEEPDILIAYHIGQQSQVDVSRCGYHYPTSPHCWGREVETYAYTEGTLVLDFIDYESEELIWRGTATSAIHDPEKVEETINEVVKKMLAKYPPG